MALKGGWCLLSFYTPERGVTPPMKTPITKQAIREHWNYSWWKYALLIILALVGWNLIYTVTAYRPPADKRVDMYVLGVGDEEKLDGYMEQMNCVFMAYDETYTTMQLMVYLAAGEGDLYMLNKEMFQSYASQGAFLPLEEIPGLVDRLAESGVKLDKGWRTNSESGEKHLYGIPMASFPGLAEYLYTYEESYLSIAALNGNDENCVKFLNIFLQDMLTAPEVDGEVPAE